MLQRSEIHEHCLSSRVSGAQRTNRPNTEINVRRHDLVPLVNLFHAPLAPAEAPDATERVHEFSIGGEVALDCCFLKGGRGLCEELDDFWDFGDCITNGVRTERSLGDGDGN